MVISLDAVSSGKRRNDVRVRMEEPWARPEWELASDEPSAIGGEETAPMPLSIFATGVATCFMTQVRNFARQRGVHVNSLSVAGSFEWKFIPGPSPREPYTAKSGSVCLDIEIDSPSPMTDQQALIAAASRGCFAEAMLNVPVNHRLKSGDDWISCDAE
ncbi:OsmC family protein [Rhodococcus sp. G-MC3]|uniref:OsmC family protein n=1 Tax=Rhodococcus sp. G-MC3 TaxID=3046209 RepID=UPI0024B88F40|nr:OsmC family protein [Rhodococcus sp. G-MC3]MDJ0396391.1 OsmC family protein [Rhodococcus sp. G-MC3]